MISSLNYAGLVIVVFLCFALYSVNYETQAARDRLAEVEREVADAGEHLRVLNAEWSLLNQPDRLERLAARFLDLEPISPVQLATLNTLPLPAALEVVPADLGGAGPERGEGQPISVAAAGDRVLLPISVNARKVEVIWQR